MEYNLAQLQKCNDLDVIWKKASNVYGQSISERLSEASAAKVSPDSGLDAYSALTLLQQCPEYQQDETLKHQVDYALGCITSIMEDLSKGMTQITAFSFIPSTALYESSIPTEYTDMTLNELCNIVRQFLKDHSEWKAMSDTYALLSSSKTSNYLTTLEALDSQELEDLYAKVADVAIDYWPIAFDLLDNHYSLVPFPVGSIFEWSDAAKTDAERLDLISQFPTSAVGG